MKEWRYSSTIVDLALDGGEWSDLLRGRCTHEDRDFCTHYIAGWVVPRAGLDAVEKRKKNLMPLPGIEPSP
jgi:hypothetical protein